MSADESRDLVFLPTSSASPDFYGGERLGHNAHANSIVALRASTGTVVWSFQVVHHDLWDYDVAAQPLLASLRTRIGEVPVVIVGTKTGMLFVLHRETGVPILDVEERGVPRSDVPGEVAWPTQPFPRVPPPLLGERLTPDSAFGVNEEDRVFCRERIRALRNEGIFTPPSFQGTLQWPGFWGGVNWDGLAWDPVNQRVVLTLKRVAMMVTLHERTSHGIGAATILGAEFLAQDGARYGASRAPVVAPSGIPCTPPPWGKLVAVDVSSESASVRWSRPLGSVPWLRSHPGHSDWGSIIFGGPIITAGGLVFVGASQDNRLHAFDVDTGELLWEHQLPAGGQATPMTYVFEGKQYVVMAAGGRGGVGAPNGWIVAFALPD
jgi:quinoprotein glucose dehydrogenase